MAIATGGGILFPGEANPRYYAGDAELAAAIGHVPVVCDTDDGERSCACGSGMSFVRCYGCDDGYIPGDQLVDEDPLWYDGTELVPCGLCLGAGGWWSCFTVRSDE